MVDVDGAAEFNEGQMKVVIGDDNTKEGTLVRRNMGVSSSKNVTPRAVVKKRVAV